MGLTDDEKKELEALFKIQDILKHLSWEQQKVIVVTITNWVESHGFPDVDQNYINLAKLKVEEFYKK